MPSFPIRGTLKSYFKNVSDKEITVVGFVRCPYHGSSQDKLMVVYLENKKFREAFAEDFTAHEEI